ncbi:MAG: M23 family metallopeptidase [Patescibacteria group bacterium]|nr:M23 family metallopeptidase [Patescibacteria group bacterium]
MGKTIFWGKTIWKGIRESNINISIIILSLAVLMADFLLRADPVGGAFLEGASFQKVDTKKADLVLSYLTQIVPPFQTDSTGPGFLSEGNAFLAKPTITNTIISTLARDSITTYTISEGETYWTVAYRFEIDIDTLLWANNISDVNKIEVGKKLIILPTNGLLYTTAPGDTVEGVSKAFNVAKDKIMAQNKLTSNVLAADTQLVLPGARKYVPKPSTAIPNYAGDTSYYTGSVLAGSGNFGWPINSGARFFSQYFGWVTKYYKHTGIDLDWRNGSDIIASDTGTVVAASYGWGGGYGNHIIIDHGNGYQTLYAHLSRIDVNLGQNVSRGQHVGVMGSTGISTGTHLHFEVRQNGVAINPLIYVQ